MDPFGAREPARSSAANKDEFARFYGREFPRLVALLHALRGDRAHAQRVAERAFRRAWLSWPKVRTLPDPAAWVRRGARRSRAPRNADPTRYSHAFESDWIAPQVLPVVEALSRLSATQRNLLVLHHVGGLTVEQIADEEGLAPATATMDLASARAALAHQLGGPSPSRGYADVRDVRTNDAMANLAHALSYARDPRGPDQVFRSAARHRASIVGVAVAVALSGVAGTTAIVGSLGTWFTDGVPGAVTPLTIDPSVPGTRGYPPAAPVPGNWGGVHGPVPVPAPAVTPGPIGAHPVLSEPLSVSPARMPPAQVRPPDPERPPTVPDVPEPDKFAAPDFREYERPHGPAYPEGGDPVDEPGFSGPPGAAPPAASSGSSDRQRTATTRPNQSPPAESSDRSARGAAASSGGSSSGADSPVTRNGSANEEPRSADPGRGGPRSADPGRGDPRSADPGRGGPRSADPGRGGPRNGETRSGETRSGETRSGETRSDETASGENRINNNGRDGSSRSGGSRRDDDSSSDDPDRPSGRGSADHGGDQGSRSRDGRERSGGGHSGGGRSGGGHSGGGRSGGERSGGGHSGDGHSGDGHSGGEHSGGGGHHGR